MPGSNIQRVISHLGGLQWAKIDRVGDEPEFGATLGPSRCDVGTGAFLNPDVDIAISRQEDTGMLLGADSG